MERRIRFLPYLGRRVAYELLGSGPALVVPAWWVGHLEHEWQDDRVRDFWQSLAEHHMVVRYDRLGVGLSDRRVDPDELSLEHDVELLLTLVDRLELERPTLFAGSSGACTAVMLASQHPERVERLILCGAFANGREIASPDLRRALVELVRAHWGVGSRMLADIFLPEADDADRDAFARFQRLAAAPETAARLLELVYQLDVEDVLAGVQAPTLVLHRDGDHSIPYELGLAVAARIPGASFVPLTGRDHFPWRGNAAPVVRAIRRFLKDGSAQASAERSPSPLSTRELDILELVAQGLTDPEIAESLVVSRHTVHRHVANIRRKLGQSSRTAAVAEAARLGLL